MAKWIKNTTGTTKTYVGKDITAGAYRELDSSDELKWINDSTLLADIGSGDAIVAKDNSGNEDITDINLAINYLKDLKTELEVDDEGRQTSRTAYGKKGWTYLAQPVEFETSKLDSTYSKNWLDEDRNDVTVTFHDSDGDALTGQTEIDSSCVETRVTLAPPFDYEIISGKMIQEEAPTGDVRLWVVGGVIDTTNNHPWEYPADSGVFHVKEFAGGINLKFMGNDQELETDGRASKYMCKDKTGVPYAANQFQYILRHPAGEQHRISVIMEYFRE